MNSKLGPWIIVLVGAAPVLLAGCAALGGQDDCVGVRRPINLQGSVIDGAAPAHPAARRDEAEGPRTPGQDVQ